MSTVKMPEPAMRIYAEGDIRTVTEWRDGARDLPDGDHDLITTTQAEAYAAAKVREAQQWQPIETAPKDGTTILVWFKQHGAMTVCWGDRDYNHTSEYAVWLVDDHKHGPYPVRGYSRGDDTHWMPLPAPPQQ